MLATAYNDVTSFPTNTGESEPQAWAGPSLPVMALLLVLPVAGVWAQPSLPATSGHEFTLVRDGRGQATIVLARDPSPSARFAAHELQGHIKKITGVTLPITADDVRTDNPRILVGPSAGTRALNVRADDLGAQEYLIRFLPDTLVLLGKDTVEEKI
jgi:hypothetical protein